MQTQQLQKMFGEQLADNNSLLSFKMLTWTRKYFYFGKTFLLDILLCSCLPLP